MATSGYPSTTELTLVLLGTLGCGKTASADTILGQVAAASPPSSGGSSSRVCLRRQGVSEGRTVTVVETPRWYWNGQRVEESVRKESQRALQLAAPGPHAFLLLIPVCQFTEVEGRVPGEMKEVFGPEVLKHTLVLLTCGDYLAGQTEEIYLQGEDPGLREVIGCCGGRYHIINNRQRHDRQQVRTLLDKVEVMVAMNGGAYVQTSPQRGVKDQTPSQKQPPSTRERFRLLEEKKAAVRDTTDYQEPPVAAGRRGTDMTMKPEFLRHEGLLSSEALGTQRSPPRHGNGLDGMYSSVIDGSVLGQLNAAECATVPQVSKVKPNEKTIQTSYQEINSIREQSSHQPSPSFSSPQSPSSGSSSSLLASSSSPSRLPPSSSSSSQLPSSASSSSQLPSSSSLSSSKQTFSSSSSKSQLPSSSSSSSKSQLPSSSSSSKSQLPSSSSLPQSQLPSPSSLSKSQLPSSSSSKSQLPSSSSLPQSQLPSPSSLSQSQLPSSSLTSSYPMSSSLELRLVLLGNSGVGKSAAGNSILGKEEFETRPNSLVAVTQQCEKRRALVAGRKVAVIDTPDWFHAECSPDEVRAQISSCVALSSPGPHAFLLCVPLDRPARSELQALGVLEAVFGAEAVRMHTLLLFTQADQLRASGKMGGGSDVEAYIGAERADLVKLVERCGDRFHVLERGPGGAGERSVIQLLERVEQTVLEAGGGCYSCPAFQEAEERVRQRQREIAHERRGGRGEQGEPRAGRPSMRTLPEADEDQEDIAEARDEAERTVGAMRLESLPPITASALSPSLMSSMREMVESTANWLPKMLSDGSVMVGDGVRKAAQSPVWGKMGTGAKDVQRMVADSSVWERVRSGAGGVTQPMADSSVWEKIGATKVPGLMSGSSSALRSRAKLVADSAMWGKVGSGAKSGAKLMSNSSIWVGSGAKSLAQSPVWGQVRSGAKSGAKMMADGSVRVGAGLGEGVKKVARSPVWGKMGSGAKAGAQMVSESPVWEKMLTEAKKVPMVVAGGALLGLLLGVVLGGVLGGAIGAATGSAITEVGRRKFSKDGNSVHQMQSGGMGNIMMEGEQSLLQSGQQHFKAQ
ncbi:uncharacterized protein LOC132453913 isoform X1 [Gadus macrocephalus]|uniref:uncharacterized protein LOC132453913 isoform X1 n=1 Tax=Gadus macrocephalus TaxID=80720 RepID=UPI0028CBA7AC|nr:uncharacterized protein LOC132453913 isoform X1 [Gadus macrocephalus]